MKEGGGGGPQGTDDTDDLTLIRHLSLTSGGDNHDWWVHCHTQAPPQWVYPRSVVMWCCGCS